MRVDSEVNADPVDPQSRIVTEPAGEKRLLKAPLAGAVLFGVGTPTIEAARQRRFDEGRFGGECGSGGSAEPNRDRARRREAPPKKAPKTSVFLGFFYLGLCSFPKVNTEWTQFFQNGIP